MVTAFGGVASTAAMFRACDLREPTTQTLFEAGRHVAALVLVGARPDHQEVRAGRLAHELRSCSRG